jgi:hypothetical protein
MLICRKAVIGLIFLACSIFAAFFIGRVATRPLVDLTVQLIISGFTYYAIMHTPVIVLTIVGLAFYIVGKRELKKHSTLHPEIIISSSVLGVFLLVFGVFTWPPVGYYAGKTGRTLIDQYITCSPPILLSVLWVISGIVLIVDSWRYLKASN